MMYRSGWGHKPGQERVLAIEISRGGWEWALSHSCLSHYAPSVYDSREAWSAAKASSPVRSGAITDDTQMTLFTAEGLLRARRHGGDVPSALWQAYQRWLLTPGPGHGWPRG